METHEKIEKKLPKICKSKDLIRLKVFDSMGQIKKLVREGLLAPDARSDNGNYLFSNDTILDFLKGKKCSKNKSKKTEKMVRTSKKIDKIAQRNFDYYIVFWTYNVQSLLDDIEDNSY